MKVRNYQSYSRLLEYKIAGIVGAFSFIFRDYSIMNSDGCGGVVVLEIGVGERLTAECFAELCICQNRSALEEGRAILDEKMVIKVVGSELCRVSAEYGLDDECDLTRQEDEVSVL